jgi:predicted GIY-YIG superfamily endonuclease
MILNNLDFSEIPPWLWSQDAYLSYQSGQMIPELVGVEYPTMERHPVQKQPALYCFVDLFNKNNILYIGSTVNAKTRLHQHISRDNGVLDKCTNDGIYPAFYLHHCMKETLRLEYRLIDVYRPLYNTVIKY